MVYPVILKILFDYSKPNILVSLNVPSIDDICKVLAGLLYVLDNILRKFNSNNIFIDIILIIFTIYHD